MEFSRLANIISGKIGGSNREQAQADKFLEQYGPLLQKYIEKQKQDSENK